MMIAFNRVPRLVFRVSLLSLALALLGCASTPRDRSQDTRHERGEAVASESPALAAFGDEIALRAIAQVGKPYLYGGADLNGFDCSGLVFFIHRDLGVTVPRTAAAQYAASRPVNVRRLEPGDLLFFRTTKRKRVTHVAIYAGDGRFVHAPQSGRTIELHELSDDYYGPRLVGAGRLSNGE